MKKILISLVLILITCHLFGSEPGAKRINLLRYSCFPVEARGSAYHYLMNPQQSTDNFATNRGSMMLGGGFSFQFRKGVDEFVGQSISLDFEPMVMVFVAPSFAIGGTVLANYYKYEDNEASTHWGVGPTLTYYIAGHTKKTIYPFFEGSFIVTGNSYVITFSELEFGGMFMLSDAVGLTMSLKYRLDIHYPEGSQAEHVNNLIFGIGLRSFVFR